MGKKAKANRMQSYKAFLNGMVTYREKFVDAKIALIDQLLADTSLKESLSKKDRKEMTKVERAALDTILTKELGTVEEFEELKAKLKDTQVKRAKFKYSAKEI